MCFFFEVIKFRCRTHLFLHYISFRAHLYPKLLQPWRRGGDTGDSEWEWKGTKILIAKWSRTSAKGVRADVVTVSVTVCLRLEEHVGLGELGSWGTLECKPVACACVVQLLPLPLPHAEPQLVDWLMRPQWRWWRALSPTGTTSFRLESSCENYWDTFPPAMGTRSKTRSNPPQQFVPVCGPSTAPLSGGHWRLSCPRLRNKWAS